MRATSLRILALSFGIAASGAAQEAPLFAEDAPLEVTLAFDVEAVTDDWSEAPPWYPATLSTPEAPLDVGVRTRGFYRLHYLDCDVPPLRLNVRRRATSGTVFEGQDKLKLVTHCENRSEAFQQYVLQEYLVYRAYARLTDLSFRTRLVRITYRDTVGEHDDVTRLGFLIEDDDALADRLGGEIVKREGVHPDATDREQVGLMSVFHYMVGNTDWTVSTLHNVRLVYRPEVAARLTEAGVFDGSASALAAVPYDFDWSGLIGAPYATPDPQLGIRSVRDRIYLGFCRTPDELAPVLDRFRAAEADLTALFRDSPHLDPEVAEASAEYLADFFEQIGTERGVERMLRDCLDG